MALGQLGDREAVPALIEAVENFTDFFHTTVRVAACASLGQLADRSAVPALLNAIDDPMADISAEAIGALAALGDERAIEPIAEVLRNGDGFYLPMVCLAAANALRELALPQATTAPGGIAVSAAKDPGRFAAAVPAAHSAEIAGDAIAKAAYGIWERNGRREGESLANWFQAEAELRAIISNVPQEN